MFYQYNLNHKKTSLSLYYLNFFIILRVFKIVNKVTPVSANTASHILASPKTLRTKITAFTPIANIKFSLIICLVYLLILIPSRHLISLYHLLQLLGLNLHSPSRYLHYFFLIQVRRLFHHLQI